MWRLLRLTLINAMTKCITVLCIDIHIQGNKSNASLVETNISHENKMPALAAELRRHADLPGSISQALPLTSKLL